tara:strand:- start:6822 stop:8006 length:1185 start_codon:yes stop_codon:yes gene_type:complete
MDLKILSKIPYVLLIFVLWQCKEQKRIKKNTKPAVAIMAYYLPRAEFKPEKIPLEKLTHILFSFSHIVDGKMKFKNPDSSEKLKQLVSQKSRNPKIKIMIACGGWGADGFSEMASSEKGRQKFIKSTLKFIEDYKLDGLDIDWEYPGIPAAGTKSSSNDKTNFSLLMKGLRENLDTLNRPMTLSFASAGWKPYYKNIEINEVMKYADYINIMSYDQVTDSSPYTAHHTALGWIKKSDIIDTPTGMAVYAQNNDYEPLSAEMIIAYCINQGINPEQIIIGGAFYSRAWQGVPPTLNGLYQPNKGAYRSAGSYNNIREKFENKNGYIRYWDSIAKAPYLYNAKDSIFISYDDPKSLALKTNYAITNKLGGIMFWQLGGDTTEKDGLLEAIYSTATK